MLDREPPYLVEALGLQVLHGSENAGGEWGVECLSALPQGNPEHLTVLMLGLLLGPGHVWAGPENTEGSRVTFGTVHFLPIGCKQTPT